MGKAKVTWNTDMDRKLLLYFIADSTAKLNLAGAAAHMSSGPESSFTQNAIYKRMQKLKELGKAASGGSSGQQGGNGASKESPPMKKGKQGTKRTAGDYLEEDDDEDEDDEETVPFRKKPRVKSACKGGKRQQTGVEKEDEDEEGFTVKPEPGYGGYGEDDDEKGPWADPDLDVSLDQY